MYLLNLAVLLPGLLAVGLAGWARRRMVTVPAGVPHRADRMRVLFHTAAGGAAVLLALGVMAAIVLNSPWV